jgi:hypothetical protein
MFIRAFTYRPGDASKRHPGHEMMGEVVEVREWYGRQRSAVTTQKRENVALALLMVAGAMLLDCVGRVHAHSSDGHAASHDDQSS